MKYLSLLFLVICAYAHGQTTWTVTPPVVTSSAGATYPTLAACQAAVETLAPANYTCTQGVVTTITGVASGSSSSSGGSSSGSSSSSSSSSGGSSSSSSSGGSSSGAGTSVSMVYSNGKFYWPGTWDNTANLSANYTDTTANAAGDIKFVSLQKYAIWLPYAPQDGPPISPGNSALTQSFNTTGYNYLSLQIEPTVAGQQWSMQAYKYSISSAGVMTGDITLTSSVVFISSYCSTFKAGSWMTCKVPLSALNAVNQTQLYKFSLQDQSGQVGDTWYVNNVEFTQ